MNNVTSTLFLPAWLAKRSMSAKLLAVVIGTLFLAIASRITVPMIPVPITMQTFAISMLGAIYGWRLGVVTVLLWLGEGAVGLPVLSGGASGLLHFIGPTAGYLFSFPLMVMIIGWLADQSHLINNTIVRLLIAMLIGHVVCLALGALWLAMMIGGKQAWIVGVVPFLFGSLLKSALAAVFVGTICRHKKLMQ